MDGAGAGDVVRGMCAVALYVLQHWWCSSTTCARCQLQAYFIFSIGNIKPIITAMYPACWQTYRVCDKTLTGARGLA